MCQGLWGRPYQPRKETLLLTQHALVLLGSASNAVHIYQFLAKELHGKREEPAI